jgi:hypothetical protein
VLDWRLGSARVWEKNIGAIHYDKGFERDGSEWPAVAASSMTPSHSEGSAGTADTSDGKVVATVVKLRTASAQFKGWRLSIMAAWRDMLESDHHLSYLGDKFPRKRLRCQSHKNSLWNLITYMRMGLKLPAKISSDSWKQSPKKLATHGLAARSRRMFSMNLTRASWNCVVPQ